MTPGSHVTDRAVQAASGMWTVRRVRSGAIRVATGPRSVLFPARLRAPPTSPSPFTAPPSLVAPPSLLSPVGAGALWLAGVGLTPLRRSTLAEPAERGLGLWRGSRLAGRRQGLAGAPGAAGALLVGLFPARAADHLSIMRLRPCISSLCPGKCGTLARA